MNEQEREQMRDGIENKIGFALAEGLTEEEIGIAISVACEWNVIQIARIAMYALEDSNWHSLAGVIDDAIKKELKEDYE